MISGAQTLAFAATDRQTGFHVMIPPARAGIICPTAADGLETRLYHAENVIHRIRKNLESRMRLSPPNHVFVLS